MNDENADDSPDVDPEVVKSVVDCLAQGQKIQAVRTYMDATGKSLLESKQFIEELIPGLVEKDPERFSGLSGGGSGCGAATGVLLLVAACCVMVLLVI